MKSSDLDIRIALHRKVLQSHHQCVSTFVIDELGLAHGRNRIDVAVLKGCLHGYEIKSSKDNLLRLPSQLHEYNRSLQKLTIVAAPNHIEGVISIAPKWCGVVEAYKGPRGGIKFTTLRRTYINPEVDVFSIAHLLWRKEAIQFLETLGVSNSELNIPRKLLYEKIVELASLNEIVTWIKAQFIKRENWRVDLQSM